MDGEVRKLEADRCRDCDVMRCDAVMRSSLVGDDAERGCCGVSKPKEKLDATGEAEEKRSRRRQEAGSG